MQELNAGVAPQMRSSCGEASREKILEAVANIPLTLAALGAPGPTRASAPSRVFRSTDAAAFRRGSSTLALPRRPCLRFVNSAAGGRMSGGETLPLLLQRCYANTQRIAHVCNSRLLALRDCWKTRIWNSALVLVPVLARPSIQRDSQTLLCLSEPQTRQQGASVPDAPPS